MIQERAKQYANELKINDLSSSNGCLTKFKVKLETFSQDFTR